MRWDLAVDWDDTVVDVDTKAWFPLARAALRALLGRGYTIVIHTCRANWPEGLAEVRDGLDVAGLAGMDVWTQPGKPHADRYVDNQSFPPFKGDWDALLATLPPKRTPLNQSRPRGRMWS